MEQYTTSDLGFAATLATLGYVLDDVRPVGMGTKSEFVFSYSRDFGIEQVEKLTADYYANKLTVSPLRYYQELKALKARLYGPKPRRV